VRRLIRQISNLGAGSAATAVPSEFVGCLDDRFPVSQERRVGFLSVGMRLEKLKCIADADATHMFPFNPKG